MPQDLQALRDWHRLFGLLLMDIFTGSPFIVEIERDLAPHNLLTFKSHHEALDDWALRELLAHYVAYRKLVSPSPADLLPSELFRLYAVYARFPHKLSGQLPWQVLERGS